MTTAPRIPSVGFIGLGVMGEPMAGHLAKAGHRLALFDARPQHAARLAARLGAAASAPHSPAEVARASDIVVTMVPNGEVVRDLVSGEHGLLQGFAPGALLLDTSSSEPWLTEETGARLRVRGVAMVDAPVSGAEWGAKAAELVFMVGGAAADLERVRPLLAAMGKAIFHVGGLGSGHAMKCLNNLITSANLLALSEGLAMGKRYGLDPEAMVDVLNVSTGMSWVAQTHIKQRVISRRFDDPFKLALMVKDIGIAMALARATGTPAPLSEAAQGLWRAAADAASPDASVSELVRWVERASGTEITAGAAARERP
jgi:3-hydroxyisobutyrate dehydrogenase-like beta-hydroxyacid dehydrogenase